MSRVLFIRYKKSVGVLEGGEQCSQRNLDALRSIYGEQNVDVEHIHDESIQRTAKDYALGAFWFAFGFHFGLDPFRVKRIVKKVVDNYDILFIDRSIFGILAHEARKAGFKGGIYTFFHNEEKKYFLDKMGSGISGKIVSACASRNQKWALENSTKCIFLNRRDASALGVEKPHLLPVSFEDTYSRESYPAGKTSDEPRLLFVGSYFGPNIDGLRWFIKNVLPRVDVILTVVGKDMDKMKSEVPPSVNLVSSAPSLQEYFEQADIVILPIFKGSGMKVKTCESLMYGKHILGTSEAFAGYELDYMKVGGLCNTADEFVRGINRFCRHPKPKFNLYSRELFTAHYSSASAVETLRALMQE